MQLGLIVDDGVYFIDLVSDSILVFGGESAVHGIGVGPSPSGKGWTDS